MRLRPRCAGLPAGCCCLAPLHAALLVSRARPAACPSSPPTLCRARQLCVCTCLGRAHLSGRLWLRTSAAGRPASHARSLQGPPWQVLRPAPGPERRGLPAAPASPGSPPPAAALPPGGRLRAAQVSLRQQRRQGCAERAAGPTFGAGQACGVLSQRSQLLLQLLGPSGACGSRPGGLHVRGLASQLCKRLVRLLQGLVVRLRAAKLLFKESVAPAALCPRGPGGLPGLELAGIRALCGGLRALC